MKYIIEQIDFLLGKPEFDIYDTEMEAITALAKVCSDEQTQEIFGLTEWQLLSSFEIVECEEKENVYGEPYLLATEETWCSMERKKIRRIFKP